MLFNAFLLDILMRRPFQQCYRLLSTHTQTQVFLTNMADKVVEDHPSKDLPYNGQLEDATIVPTICLVVFVFEEGNIGCVTKVMSIISSSHILVKILWNVFRVSGSTALKVSAGRP